MGGPEWDAIVNAAASLLAAIGWLWTEARLPFRSPRWSVPWLFATVVALGWYTTIWVGLGFHWWESDDARDFLRRSWPLVTLAPMVRSWVIVRNLRRQAGDVGN